MGGRQGEPENTVSMSETMVDALVRILRRQVSCGQRAAPLTAAVRAALFAPPSAARPVAGPAAPAAGEPLMAPRQTPQRVAPAPAPAPVPTRTATAVAAPPAPVPVPVLGLADTGWDELRQLVAGCRRCALCDGRTQTVFGDGNPGAELMFVGEGPGREEDEQGIPFVGAAGQLLTKMIAAMQFERSQVYIANIVKCRPPRNRVPEPGEAQACLPFLKRQIELVRPKVIVTLGATPLQYLLGKTGIGRERGIWCDLDGIPVMPTYHPAYLLRAPERKGEAWSDLKQVMARLGGSPAETSRRREGTSGTP